MILIDKIKNNTLSFIEEVKDIADFLSIDADWLMFVMYFESRLNPQAKNAYSGAVGLIQFMPSTAKNLGTTAEDLLKMDNVEQLFYVRKYLAPYAGKIKSLTDLYLCVFFPKAVGKPDDYVLQTDRLSAKTIAQQNSAFDLNSDLAVTKGEIVEYLNRWINKNKIELFASSTGRCSGLFVGIMLFALLLIVK